MHADELDLPRLIRSRLYDTKKTVAAVSREVYGRSGELTLVLSGSKACSPKSFVSLVDVLRVDGELLRVWLAAFLVSRTVEFLPLVHQAGLAERGVQATALLAPAIDDVGWKVYSRKEETGRMRLSICKMVKEHGPVESTEVARRLRLRSAVVRSAMRDLDRLGVVCGKSKREVIEGQSAMHKARIIYWSLTDLGESMLISAESSAK